MIDITITDLLIRMDRHIKDQRKPRIEDVKTWIKSLDRIRARDDQAVRGFIDRDIQQRKEIERLKGELDVADRQMEAAHRVMDRNDAQIERLCDAITQAAELCNRFDVLTARMVLLDALAKKEGN
jgi:capsule polysaccharide export protein KpsE/RkpR